MLAAAIAGCTLALAGAPPGPANGVREEPLVRWNGRQIQLDRLPPELGESARGALRAWAEWGAEEGYQLDLELSGRLLLVSRRGNPQAERQMDLARAVLARFEGELPAPLQRAVAGEPAPAAPPPPVAPERKPLPEDPEDPEGQEHPWKLAPVAPAPAAPVTSSYTWGAANAPLDSETAVLFVVRDQRDFEALLAQLARRQTYLADWVGQARAYQGFVLAEPLAAAYLEQPEGVEEWNPENELVNRLARLCLLRRFGELPNWFVQGYAWHVELAQLGAVYCFPWRDEFVGVGEHSGWNAALASTYRERDPAPGDFQGWRRGAYRDHEARTSWGVVEFLLAREKAQLPALLDELRVFRDEHGRVPDGPNAWHKDRDYEIPPEDQERLLRRHLGPEYLARASAFFREEMASLPR
jgi:hypothetical protein